jgi:hypothetical protein
MQEQQSSPAHSPAAALTVEGTPSSRRSHLETDWYDQPAPPLPHPIVYETGPVFTGLLGADGEPIYRPKQRLGFL